MTAFFSRIGLTGLAVAILAALLAVQTVRLEGFKIWPISIEGAGQKVRRLELEIGAIIAGEKAAADRQRAVNDTAARIYRDVAERIDDETDAARAGALGDAERFIASSRVRCPAAGGSPGRPDPAPGDRGPQSGQAAGAVPDLDAGLVAVPADDVRICTVNTTQAIAGRNWALELEAASSKPAAP